MHGSFPNLGCSVDIGSLVIVPHHVVIELRGRARSIRSSCCADIRVCNLDVVRVDALTNRGSFIYLFILIY